MGLIDKLRNFIDEQKERQFEREKNELVRLKKQNVKNEEQHKVRTQLAKERDRAKKFSRNPLKTTKSESIFGPSEDFKDMMRRSDEEDEEECGEHKLKQVGVFENKVNGDVLVLYKCVKCKAKVTETQEG